MGSGSNDTGYKIRVAWAAHEGSPRDTGTRAGELMKRLLPEGSFIMTDTHPDIILFMSGGSERRAVGLAGTDRPVLLLSIRGNNAYAAATEVMAWMAGRKRIAVLSDAEDAAGSGLLALWRETVTGWAALRESRAGLIGSVSGWLVASEVPAETLRQRAGISLMTIPWERMPDYAGMEPDRELLKRFDDKPVPGMEDAARVLTMLRRVISDNNLDAIGMECFSLAQQRQVTACLALAQLNAEGTVAACEGDLASMAGMMAVRAFTGTVPWMANTTRLTKESLILSHCTVPFGMVNEVTLPSHYETGYSLAVDGNFPAGEVTLFRLSESLGRAFITTGLIEGRPRMADACRTQVEIGLQPGSLRAMRERPLGNHHLLIPGDKKELLMLACRYNGIYIDGHD
jgi:L-fucose isomerase-like protein